MQDTYRCPNCNRELRTLASVGEHVNKEHAGMRAEADQGEPLKGADRPKDGMKETREHTDQMMQSRENGDQPGAPKGEGRPPDRALLTEEEEQAVEEQDVEEAEEDMERGKAAYSLEPQKWI